MDRINARSTVCHPEFDPIGPAPRARKAPLAHAASPQRAALLIRLCPDGSSLRSRAA